MFLFLYSPPVSYGCILFLYQWKYLKPYGYIIWFFSFFSTYSGKSINEYGGALPKIGLLL
jgi:hypothetical protein